MQPFTIHWSRVPRPDEESAWFALWPAPVNPDACFQAAGFTDFGDADELWESEADALLTRLLRVLSGHGVPRQTSPPVQRQAPWYRRLFSKPEVLDLRQQIEGPLTWDQLPECRVAFGVSGVSLRTSRGHHLFWITLPRAEAAAFADLLVQVAGSHSTVETSLKWEHLIG